MNLLDTLKNCHPTLIVNYVEQQNYYAYYVNSLIVDLNCSITANKLTPRLLKSGRLDKQSSQAFSSVLKKYCELYPLTNSYVAADNQNIFVHCTRCVTIRDKLGNTVTHYFKTLIYFYNFDNSKQLSCTLVKLDLTATKRAIALLKAKQVKLEKLKREVQDSELYLSGVEIECTL